MADYRYLEAWKRPSRAATTSTSHSRSTPGFNPAHLPSTSTQTQTQPQSQPQSQSQSSSYQVRLDTPGGLTYAPDVLNPHNSAKRLFIPAKLTEQDAYDFEHDIQQQRRKRNQQLRAAKGDQLNEHGQTEAQAYAAQMSTKHESESYTIPDSPPQQEQQHSNHDDAASINTNATVRSVQSKITTLTLTAEREHGLPRNVTQHALAAEFKLPPSMGAYAASDSRNPWDAKSWTGHRAFERPSERERQAGITNFEDVSASGRVPSAAEADLEAMTPDGASIRTTRTLGGNALRVQDLFIPDPRSWRPLRYVRKVDPRQMLLLCAGTTLTPGQVAANQLGASTTDAASILSSTTQHQQMYKTMLQYGKLPDYNKLAAAMPFSTQQHEPRPRGGVGFVYCPSSDPRAAAALDSLSSFHDHAATVSLAYGGGTRAEPNFSRRLERTPEFASTTKKRAGLRSVLAALEYHKWEQEGFDKIVVATHHRWIVDGIARDIWEWRHNDWRLMREGPLGFPGENVPDRDLWELLDNVVRGYEKIE